MTDKQTKGLIIDAAVPNETQMVDKEREKIEKKGEIRDLRPCRTFGPRCLSHK